MRILGVDFGLKKIGLAMAESFLAEPYMVLRYRDLTKVLLQLSQIIKKEGIEKVVIGISESRMAQESREFGKLLQTKVDKPIEYFDETLSTQESHALAIEANIKRKKRKEMEDAYAAAVMLQDYLDQNQYIP